MVFIKLYLQIAVETKIFFKLKFNKWQYSFHCSLQEFVHKICCWNLLNNLFDWFCYKTLLLNYVVLDSVFELIN